MRINFERNSYLNAIKEKPHLNSEDKIFNHVKAELRFKYVDVSIREFDQKYSADGWFGRKIIALPAAIWAGVVKTIYHFAIAILVGIMAYLGGENSLRARVFYIVRDLQESFGWLVTVLNDRYGQYHIQGSGFHKSCYEYFLSHTSTSTPRPQPIGRTPTYTPFPEPPRNLARDRENLPSDKQSVIDRMRRDPSDFSNLDVLLQDDADVVVAALSGCKTAEEAKQVMQDAGYFAKNRRNVALALVKIAPTQLGQLDFNIRDDADVVVAALSGCETAEEAKQVMQDAGYFAKSSKKVALALVKIAPTQLGQLDVDMRSADVVLAALNGCKTAEEAKRVIHHANYFAKSNKKVAFVLVKIDPTLLEQLNPDMRDDENVVVAALSSCTSSEQAKQVILHAYFFAKSSKKVALVLVKIDPILLEHLNSDVRGDLNVVLLAIELSTKLTIKKIWDFVRYPATSSLMVRTKMKEKYPDFFQREHEDFFQQKTYHRYSKFFQYDFRGFSSFGTQSTFTQAPQAAARPEWVEPDDLKGKTTEEANITRRILKQTHRSGIDLTSKDAYVSEEEAKRILRQLLEFNGKDAALKTAYRKASLRIHPDKAEIIKSSKAAFEQLTATYERTGLR